MGGEKAGDKRQELVEISHGCTTSILIREWTENFEQSMF